MNVYLWSTELNDVLKQSTELEGIYLGSNEVWTPASSLKRLAFRVETDWDPSNDWEWIDDNGYDISYVDMPVDYNGIFLTSIGSSEYEFTPLDDSRIEDSSLRFIAHLLPGQWVVFKWIKYIPSGWTVFDVDLTQTYQEALPYSETWWLLQDWDTMIMVFETSSAPTFTVANIINYNTMNSALSSATGMANFTCTATKILLWSDWYYYYATTGLESWRPMNYKNCYAKISISWDEWTQRFTVEDYYLEAAPSDDSSFCNYFGSGDSTYIPAIASYVWDPSIVDVQTLWEYIYNKLQ